MQQKFDRDLGDLEDGRQEDEAKARTRHERTIDDIATKAERARDEATATRRTRLAELEENWRENLAEIDATFYENSKTAREEFNTALEDFETDLGVAINLLRGGWQGDYLTLTRKFVSDIQAQYNRLANLRVPSAPASRGSRFTSPSQSRGLGPGSPEHVSAPATPLVDDGTRAPRPGGVDHAIASIPALDHGALVTGPTLAALAMNSKPEFVSPVERLPELLGIQGRGVTIQQYLTVQGDVLGDLDAERKIKGLAAEGVMEAIIDGKFSGTSIRLGG